MRNDRNSKGTGEEANATQPSIPGRTFNIWSAIQQTRENSILLFEVFVFGHNQKGLASLSTNLWPSLQRNEPPRYQVVKDNSLQYKQKNTESNSIHKRQAVNLDSNAPCA